MAKRIIGIFDSGIGGLTVARQIRRAMPQASYIYFGDTKYVPYGARPVGEVVALIDRICHHLVEEGARALVMACNTSSALAYDHVCEWSTVPVIGIIEAAAKAATRLSKNKRIGVISNVLTANSGAYERAINRYDSEAVVVTQGCPKLVPLVENGKVSGSEAEIALREYVDPLLSQNIDTLVFGCTHYPFFRSTLESIYGDRLTLVDPAFFVAAELQEMGWPNYSNEVAERRYEVSGDPEQFGEVAERLLGYSLGRVEVALAD